MLLKNKNKNKTQTAAAGHQLKYFVSVVFRILNLIVSDEFLISLGQICFHKPQTHWKKDILSWDKKYKYQNLKRQDLVLDSAYQTNLSHALSQLTMHVTEVSPVLFSKEREVY